VTTQRYYLGNNQEYDMAKKTDEEYRINTRAKANAALTFALLALLIAIIGIIFTIGARNRAIDAQKTANSTKQYTEETVKKAVNEASKASPGGGTGPNTPIPPVNTTPNGNGQ
jgi:hypothetical protein